MGQKWILSLCKNDINLLLKDIEFHSLSKNETWVRICSFSVIKRYGRRRLSANLDTLKDTFSLDHTYRVTELSN